MAASLTHDSFWIELPLPAESEGLMLQITVNLMSIVHK